MGSVWGHQLKLSLFGESHGAAVGIVIDGLPSGITVDETFIAREMARRSSIGKRQVTGRQEKDMVRILSGTYQGKTTGTPLTGLIENKDVRSEDYDAIIKIPRPGHGDLGAYYRYKGFHDPGGGGHGSGRLTAPLVFAGAVSKLVLKALAPRIDFQSRIVSVGHADEEKDFSYEIDAAAAEGDSVGGIVEGCITGVPKGWGDPFFDNVESRLAAFLFAVPGIKGVEFGDGFAMARSRGSMMNDPIIPSEEGFCTTSNHNGGINGGITNGMPITVRAAFKPTPSVSLLQSSVDVMTGKAVSLHITGRHDPCIALRGCAVVEAALAVVMLDLFLESQRF